MLKNKKTNQSVKFNIPNHWAKLYNNSLQHGEFLAEILASLKEYDRYYKQQNFINFTKEDLLNPNHSALSSSLVVFKKYPFTLIKVIKAYLKQSKVLKVPQTPNFYKIIEGISNIEITKSIDLSKENYVFNADNIENIFKEFKSPSPHLLLTLNINNKSIVKPSKLKSLLLPKKEYNDFVSVSHFPNYGEEGGLYYTNISPIEFSSVSDIVEFIDNLQKNNIVKNKYLDNVYTIKHVASINVK